MKKVIAFLGLCILLTGSALYAATQPDKGYEGMLKSPDELAVFSTLKAGVRMTLHKIDGVLFQPMNYDRCVVFEIYILPGTHTFELSLWGKGKDAVVKTVTFTAEAGKLYSLDGKTFTVNLGKGKDAVPVETMTADIPYYAEPKAEEPRAILEKAGSVKVTFILFRIDGQAGHSAMNGDARFNKGFDDGAFTVAVTPGTHTIEYTATVKGWAYATGPKSSTITVEAGKTYTLQAVETASGGVEVVAVEKK